MGHMKACGTGWELGGVGSGVGVGSSAGSGVGVGSSAGSSWHSGGEASREEHGSSSPTGGGASLFEGACF